MRLTGHTDYALRLLMYLGRQQGRLVTVQEIAKAHGISEHHLRKVAHRLGQAGLVATWRGRAGGLRLAQPPASISVGAVVRLAEADFTIVECFNATRNTCQLAGACRLQEGLQKATEAYLGHLDRQTLADLI